MTKTVPEFDLLDDGPALGRDGIQRDQYGRPMLVPPEGGDRIPYTSASTLADTLQDTRGLDIWDRRMIARGLGLSEELAALAAAEPYHTGLGEVDRGAMRESGRRLDEVIDRARDVAKAHQKRDWGTAFHGMTEPDNQPYVQVPPRMQPDVDSFFAELAKYRIEIGPTEIFVANDKLQTAGTFDHLVRVPGVEGWVVMDKKTGVYHPEACRIQMAVYAGGLVYDKETDQRLTFMEAYGDDVNQEFSITAHTAAMSGKTELWEEPLDLGRRAAAAAIWVRQYRRDHGRIKGRTPFQRRIP